MVIKIWQCFFFLAFLSLCLGYSFSKKIVIYLHNTDFITSGFNISIFTATVLFFFGLGQFIFRYYPSPSLVNWFLLIFTFLRLIVTIYICHFTSMPIGKSMATNFKLDTQIVMWFIALGISVMIFVLSNLFSFILFLKKRLGY